MFGAILAIALIVVAVVAVAVGLAAALSNAGDDADENFGNQPVGATSSSCPGASCPTAVEMKAPDGTSPPCQLVPVNGSLQLRAVPQPEGSGRQYRWTTSSTKIRLDNAESETVTVAGLANASASRDAETVQVECSADGCSPVTATITLTVVKVTFSKARSTTYGYDDMDTTADTTDDHVSVKKSDSTLVHTVIEGGLTGSDLEFICDDATIASPAAAPANAEFDLTVNGGNTDKGETLLKARLRCQCPNKDCGKIYINTYKEKLVEVTVAKVYDSTSAGTALTYPNLDVPSVATLINTKYKDAVVTFTCTDASSTGGGLDVRFDLDNNGKFTFDIANRGGAEFNAINAAITGRGKRVAIIKDMVSVYYLAAAAAAGATTITINTASHFYTANYRPVALGTGATRENVSILTVAGATLTLAAPLGFAHASGEAIEFPAAGWSSDPIVIMEGSSSEDTIKWTIGHECGHSPLGLGDLQNNNCMMYYSQGGADNRLRYKPLARQYDPAGNENHWELITR